MGIINISYRDDGTLDLYIDYNPILKGASLGRETYFTEVKVRTGEDGYKPVKVYLLGISIPHSPNVSGRPIGLDTSSMDIGLHLLCEGDVENRLIISYGTSRDGDRVLLVEAQSPGKRKTKPILLFRAGSDYDINKNIVARLPRFDNEAMYYRRSDAESRTVDRMYRKFVAWGREEKDFVEGGGDYLVYNTHISNLDDIIQLSLLVLNKMLNKV